MLPHYCVDFGSCDCGFDHRKSKCANNDVDVVLQILIKKLSLI